jgi:cytochrome c5
MTDSTESHEGSRGGKAPGHTPRPRPGREAHPGPRTVLAGVVLASVLALLTACSGGQAGGAQAGLTLNAVDSVLSELGGPPTASLSRQQRWRMISSIGTGLPPQDFQISELPQSETYGAAMLQVYCEQCHWLPSPQMHSAQEWPVLVRRMLMRGRMLQNRLGGPAVRSLVGGWMVDIIKKVGDPTPEQVDSIVAYLQRNALPVAGPGEVGSGPGAALFREKCSVCHQTPSPSAHTAAEWPDVVARMQSNMARMDITSLTPDELDQITSFLQGRTTR